MNVIMMLEGETGTKAEVINTDEIVTAVTRVMTRTAEGCDPLKNTEKLKPITFKNKYSALETEDDDDAEFAANENPDDNEVTSDERVYKIGVKPNLNQRQRKQRKAAKLLMMSNCYMNECRCTIGQQCDKPQADKIEDTNTDDTTSQPQPQTRRLAKCSDRNKNNTQNNKSKLRGTPHRAGPQPHVIPHRIIPRDITCNLIMGYLINSIIIIEIMTGAKRRTTCTAAHQQASKHRMHTHMA